MRSFRDRPLARTVPVFLLGIWYGTGTDIRLFFPVVALVVGLLFLLTRVRKRYVWLPYGCRWLVGLAVYGCLFTAGTLIGTLEDERSSSTHIIHRDHEAFSGVITGSPRRKGSRYRAYVRSDLILSEGKWLPASGDVLLYFPTGSDSDIPASGQRIHVKRKCEPVPTSAIPGQFDFRRWLALKQVHRMVRLRKGEWAIVDLPPALTVQMHMEKWQQRLVQCYKDAGFSGNELGVVSALVLGDDGEVDAGLMHAFAASGTLHVLSVSGMHVALVYGAVERVLILLFRRKRNRWPQFLLSFTVLWSYALLTGFSPAVRRAAAMLSLVLLGKAVNRTADTWNLLAGSLLILVAFQPYLLRESGFQLSYAAVAGIIGFYPWLRSRMDPVGKAGEAVFTAVAVALAAQWFTFPLGLYHFHRFPNYFLPANLVIIPWTTVLLFGGILLLLLHPFPLVFQSYGALLRHATTWLNKTVLLFDRLPNAETTGVWISGSECLLLSGAVVLVTVFLVLRKNEYLFGSLFILIVFSGSMLHRGLQDSNRLFTVDWHTRPSTLTVVQGHRSFTWSGSSNQKPDMIRQRMISEGLDALDIPRVHQSSSFSGAVGEAASKGFPVLFFHGRILLPDTVVDLGKISFR